MKDYYALLNVKPNASAAQIDAAYRRLMQKYHPTARSSPQMLDRLRDMNEAWRVLSDPAQRAEYDRARQEGQTFQPQTAPATARAMPQPATAEWNAPLVNSGSCLVRSVVALVLVFALAVFLWGLSQQVDFVAWWEQTQQEIREYILRDGNPAVKLAENEMTATPDPRCRSGCETPPAGCVVKGDVESGGARFFYLPNDAGYGSVRIDLAKGDRWFCAVGDAQAAGWTRKAPTETPTLPPPPRSIYDGDSAQKFGRVHGKCRAVSGSR